MRSPLVTFASAIALSLLVVAGGVATPAHAAPITTDVSASSRTLPVGGALLRMEKGDMTAVKTGEVRYRLTLPAGAAIRWTGESAPGRLAAGTFSPVVLVSRWESLGHRRGVGVLTTLTWLDGKGEKTWARALVSNPRVSQSGQLVLDARTSTRLPERLRDYTVNMLPVAPQGRGFPVTGDFMFIGGNVTLYSTIDSASQVTLRMSYTASEGAPEVACWNFVNKTSYPKYVFGTGSNDWVAFTPICGTYKYEASSYVQITGATSSAPGQERVSLSWRIPNVSGVQSTDWVLTSWTQDGTLVQPVQKY